MRHEYDTYILIASRCDTTDVVHIQKGHFAHKNFEQQRN